MLLETYRRFLFCNTTHSVCACLRFPNLEHPVVFASGGLRSTISDCKVTHFTPHDVPMQPLLPEHGDLQKVSLFQHLCLLYHRSLALHQSYSVAPPSLGTCGVGGLPFQHRPSSVLDVIGRCLRHSPSHRLHIFKFCPRDSIPRAKIRSPWSIWIRDQYL